MSINRDMREYELQKKTMVQTPSGAQKEKWEFVKHILVAVYKKNDMKVVTSEKYTESTHTALTRYKDMDADNYRLVKEEKIYEIMSCNTEGRLTNMILKAVS